MIQWFFECMRCGLRFEPKGFESSGTFYTLCEKCGEEVFFRIYEGWQTHRKKTRILSHLLGTDNSSGGVFDCVRNDVSVADAGWWG